MGDFLSFWQKLINNKTLLVLLLLVAILMISLFYQNDSMKKQMDLKIQFIEQKNILRNELDDLIDEHDELLDEYGDLNNQLFKNDSVIKNQILEIKNLIETNQDLKQAKEITNRNLKEARIKIENLKRISKKYLADIDSLFFVNERLTTEKDSVIKVNKNINWKNYKLNKKNIQLSEKVDMGSVLEIFDITVEAFRYRVTGKEVQTRSAEKTQTLRSCFTISANQIAIAENKIIQLQFINPRGDVLVLNDSISSDSANIYSITHNVLYENKEIFMCLDFERNKMLIDGNYYLKLFISDIFLSEVKFNLR